MESSASRRCVVETLGFGILTFSLTFFGRPGAIGGSAFLPTAVRAYVIRLYTPASSFHRPPIAPAGLSAQMAFCLQAKSITASLARRPHRDGGRDRRSHHRRNIVRNRLPPPPGRFVARATVAYRALTPPGSGSRRNRIVLPSCCPCRDITCHDAPAGAEAW